MSIVLHKYQAISIYGQSTSFWLVDYGLISANVPTEEEIFEELLVVEVVSQQTQVQIEEDSIDEEEEPISIQLGRQALETAKNKGNLRLKTMRYMRDIIRRLDELEKLKRQRSILTNKISCATKLKCLYGVGHLKPEIKYPTFKTLRLLYWRV